MPASGQGASAVAVPGLGGQGHDGDASLAPRPMISDAG